MANSTTQFGGFLTNIGVAQQANSAALGVPWNIGFMLIGDAGGEPSQAPDPTPKPTQVALVRQVHRMQLNALYPSPADPAVLVAEAVLPPEVGGFWIRELGLEDSAGNMIAVAAPAPSYKPLLTQGSGRTQTIRMHVVFGNVANITLKIDPSIVLATRDYVDKAREVTELYVRNQLKAHTDAADPHPQYLLRSSVAADAGRLSWLGTAGGTAGALTFSMVSGEPKLSALAAGQRFQFVAALANPGAVTAKIGTLAAKAIKKATDSGLVDLDPGDIKPGALYDLNYDGAVFQLGGGVGGGKAFERFSFTASAGQSQFAFPHAGASVIALRNGREVRDFSSNADFTKVTFGIPCEIDEAVEFLVFGSFKVSGAYTKAEVDALLKTASALPVGSMLPFPAGVVPPGFLETDGSIRSIAAYPDLAAYVGTTFNVGNEGAGNFRLPDTRGEFLRGWDHGRGIDTGRGVGSYQTAAGPVLGIDSRISSAAGTIPPYSVTVPADGSKTAWLNTGDANSSGDVDLKFSLDSSGVRPRNLAVMWCIKAWNAPVNQGNIDVAALVALSAQATEAIQGTLKIASDDQVVEGSDNKTAVSPRKLRLGFNVSWGANGFLVCPTWLGGLTFQWGVIAEAARFSEFDYGTVALPIAFPRAPLFATCQVTGQAASPADSFGVLKAITATAISLMAGSNLQTTHTHGMRWFAVGY
ncbi:phage-related tail fiber protein [Pseudomonas asplenii]|uniref:Phage-related tail fiber protein n=1 Tax=Pseudomonas asplenii TaxID=53407 RepID=A0A0N0E1T2_9PSED|nr:phage tail protein [Pseudomonas fuscovaginae]KPA88069.1 phage-related tail fiber protein [Pseudomonas fuscovaginae]